MRVLIVDDSPEVVELLRSVLVQDGHEVDVADNGRVALEAAKTFAPDVILLDLVLPEIDGLEVCRHMREMTDAHIIMVTAKDDEIDRVVGLTVGADDYVTKPFYPREISARISAVGRRSRAPVASPPPQARVFGDLRIEPEARRVTVNGQEVILTKKEFDLLEAITARPRVVHTREMLKDSIWGPDWFGDDHVVDVHIGNLRKKIDSSGGRSRIETVRGVGFRLAGNW
ncbi:response regulator transcription factor [Mycolicibacterium sp. 3033]|nr:response regulator transcription factor [Mycolicibacterium aurantiacum]